MRTPTMHPRRAGLLAFGLAASVMIGACGGDDDGNDTTVPVTDATVPSTDVPTTDTPTTDVPTTEGMGSNVESLSYLIQALLTTEQIGGGWVDQGRIIIPPGSDQLTGFLCQYGESGVAEIAGRLDPQVATSYQRADDVGLQTSEALMWGDRDQVTADFERFASAVRACADQGSYTTTELGEITLTENEAPALGTSAIAFSFGPTVAPTDTPWMQQQMTAILLSDPNESVALVVWVAAMSFHDPPDLQVTVLDPAEYTRIVETAVSRIVEQGI